MGAVQLAQHFGKHFCKVIVVVDVRKELFIRFFISRPVDAVDCRIVELLQYLTPSVVEDIFALFGRAISKFGFECDRLRLAVFDFDFLQLASRYEEDVFAFLVGEHRAATDTFDQQFGCVFLEVMFPQIVTVFESGAVIQFVAFRSQDGIA